MRAQRPAPPAGLVCWRCGAASEDGAPLSGCTEKRGPGRPWAHDYKKPGTDHPWAADSDQDLVDLVDYLAMKATGSWMTCLAFGELETLAGRYAEELYREKAMKRGRLLRWAIGELTIRIHRRLSSDPIDYDNLIHNKPFHLGRMSGCYACDLIAARKKKEASHADPAQA